MNFLERIAECTATDLSRYRSFRDEDAELGLVRDDFAEVLGEFPEVFRVSKWSVDLAARLAAPDQRTEAVGAVLRTLAGRGMIPGWRDEPYPIGTSFRDARLLHHGACRRAPVRAVRLRGARERLCAGRRRHGDVDRPTRPRQADGSGQARPVGGRRPAGRGDAQGQPDQRVRRGGEPFASAGGAKRCR